MLDNFGPDTLHRLVKHAVDSGAAGTFEEAHAKFQGYRLAIEVDEAYACQASHQATILTLAVLAKRVFLGGVTFSGGLDAHMVLGNSPSQSLRETLTTLGAEIGKPQDVVPTIVVGPRSDPRGGFCVRTATGGWRGGVLPIDAKVDPEPGPDMPLSGMLAAALAVNAAYAFVSGECIAAHRERAGLSLWDPDTSADWMSADGTEPVLTFLPSRLWLIGLGHLGQAYLWALGLLPYADPSQVLIGLHDTDFITSSTQSTSVLTSADMVGLHKTRALAKWVEERGFRSIICERDFDYTFRRRPQDPPIALCGVDNALARRALDASDFDFVVEAGLGRGHRDFRKIRIHTLPGARSAEMIWPVSPTNPSEPINSAYTDLRDTGALDQCGMTQLANKAIGAPFVGAVAATMVLSEVLRLLHGAPVCGQIELDMMSIDQRSVVKNPQDFHSLNPGFSPAIGGE